MDDVDNEHMRLLAEVQAGDRDSMDRLAALVRERLYPFAFRTTLDHDVTEDVLQETLVSMLRGVDSLRNPACFWPWLYRIAWNKIQDTRRRRRLDSNVEGTLLSEPVPEPDDLSVLDAQVRAETLAQVSKAVDQLSREHRDVVRLRCYHQLPYSDIASMTRSTPQRVRIQFHRAKQSLKARLACCV